MTAPAVHILWMNGGLGCDGESIALTAATQPSIEEIMQGADTFIEWWHKADRG